MEENLQLVERESQNNLYEDRIIIDERSSMPKDLIKTNNRKVLTRGEIFGGTDGASMPTEPIVVKKEKQYKHIITPDEIFGDKGIVYPVGYMPQEKQKLRKYPFIDTKEFSKYWTSTIKDYLLYHLTSFGYTALNVEANAQTSLPWKFIDGIFRSAMFGFEEGYKNKWPNMFPKIGVWKRFSEGSSETGEVYTVEMANFEFPIYMRDIEGKIPQPSDDLLKESIDKTAETGRAPCDDVEAVIPLYIPGFSRLAAGKYTRGDFESPMLEDPRKFRQWMVRDDSWLIQQYGNITDTKTIILDNGTPVTVRVYDRPNWLLTWWYWFFGDQTYDIIDAPIDPLQRLIETFSRDAGQLFLKEEYKVIAGIRRGFFNTGRNPLLYNVADLPATLAPDLTPYRSP